MANSIAMSLALIYYRSSFAAGIRRQELKHCRLSAISGTMPTDRRGRSPINITNTAAMASMRPVITWRSATCSRAAIVRLEVEHASDSDVEPTGKKWRNSNGRKFTADDAQPADSVSSWIKLPKSVSRRNKMMSRVTGGSPRWPTIVCGYWSGWGRYHGQNSAWPTAFQ